MAEGKTREARYAWKNSNKINKNLVKFLILILVAVLGVYLTFHFLSNYLQITW
jgi:hypothetical protein